MVDFLDWLIGVPLGVPHMNVNHENPHSISNTQEIPSGKLTVCY